MYALTVTIEDELLQRIKNAKTPKEALTPGQRFLQRIMMRDYKGLKVSFFRSLNGI